MNNLNLEDYNIENYNPDDKVIEKSDIIEKNAVEIITFCLQKENSIKRHNNIDEYKQMCMIKFTKFHQNYPTLFFSIIENPSTFPLYRLKDMLNLKRKIENNEINEDGASVKLGQKYYDEFVKDTVTDLDKQLKKK